MAHLRLLRYWPQIADALHPTAIIVVCLASFRALFTRQSRRPRIPVESDNARKLVLPAALRNNGINTTFIRASGGDTETQFLTTSSGELEVSVVPMDKVHVRHEIKLSSSAIDVEQGEVKVVDDYASSQAHLVS